MKQRERQVFNLKERREMRHSRMTRCRPLFAEMHLDCQPKATIYMTLALVGVTLKRIL